MKNSSEFLEEDSRDVTTEEKSDLQQMRKIHSYKNIVQLMSNKISRNEIFCSFELFPVKRDAGIYQRFFREVDKFSPIFYALTWHEKPTNTECLSLKLIESFPSNTLLHLTGRGLKRENVEVILEKALACGINNVFALQGDSTLEAGDFPHAVDLVTFIRKRFNNKFCISVAGYPEMHPKSSSKEIDLHYLKAKVDEGADFIITQIIFESKIFLDFVSDCRKVGINVPILPGIFPIPHYKCLQNMMGICKINVPKKILNQLELLKDNNEAAYNFGINLAVDLIKDVVSSGASPGFHLFTLNKPSLAVDVCNRLGFWQHPLEKIIKENNF